MLVSVILAAGKGTRMRSDLPKVLHPLLGAPLLEHVLDSAEPLSPTQKVVVVGYARDKVQAAFSTRGITWAIQEEQLGTAHAAHCGVEALDSGEDKAPRGDDTDVLILNGDLPLLRSETLKALLEEHARAAAKVSILTCDLEDPTGYGRIVRSKEGHLERIVEEKDADATTRLIPEVNVGIYVFRLSVFKAAYKQIGRNNAQGELYLTDVVVEAAKAGHRVATYKAADAREVAQVNSRAELARASQLLRERMLDDYMLHGVTIDDPASTYIEKGVSIGAESHIFPFTVIHRGVEIGEGCDVGPFVHLRSGTRISKGGSIGNFVELKNSSIGVDTKVRHLSYVGDSEIGARVNIGAGTIVANYDGKKKHKTVVKDDAFVGSGTVIVAPVTIGKGAMTGAGSVILRDRNVGDGEVVAGVPAKPLKKANHLKTTTRS